MKAMMLGFATIGAIAIGAYYTLDYIGFSSSDVTKSQSNVRLDN